MSITSSFAKIGKKPLITLLGVQPNFKVEYEDESVLDHDNHTCQNCRVYSTMQLLEQAGKTEQVKECIGMCEECSHACRKTVSKVKYVNERNQFGNRVALQSNAILLFMALHFLDVDNQGFIQHVQTSQMAELLHCDRKTIHNNIQALVKYHYIMSGAEYDGEYTIYLPDYKNYFMPADKGGRGYLNLSLDIFDELVKVHSITALRLYLRVLAERDATTDVDQTSTKTYKEMKRYLPRYCNRSVIQGALMKATSAAFLFDIDLTDKTSVAFAYEKEYSVKELKAREFEDTYQQLTDFCNDTYLEELGRLVDAQTQVRLYGHAPSQYRFVGEDTDLDPLVFSPDSVMISEFAHIAMRYSLSLTKQAIRKLFFFGENIRKKTKNPAAYLRKYLRQQYSVQYA